MTIQFNRENNMLEQSLESGNNQSDTNTYVSVRNGLNDYMDISKGSIDKYWQSKDSRLSDIIKIMESTEDWAFGPDNENIESALKKFYETLEKQGNQISINSVSEEILFLLAYMQSGRALRVMEWMDKRFHGMGLRLFQKSTSMLRRDEADGNEYPEARLLINRIDTLRRVDQLGKIFGPSRMRIILRALDEINK